MEKPYGNHNYRFRKKTVEESARNCVDTIRNCKELEKMMLQGFIGGISKGKCPTILADSLGFLHKDLEKQIFDYHLVVAQNKDARKALADLINVASCMFIKLEHFSKK